MLCIISDILGGVWFSNTQCYIFCKIYISVIIYNVTFLINTWLPSCKKNLSLGIKVKSSTEQHFTVLWLELCKKIDMAIYCNIYFRDIILAPKIDILKKKKSVLNRFWTTTSVPVDIASGAVHTKTLFCENAHILHRFGRPSTRILKTQRLKTHFFETRSQGGEIQKCSPPVFMWTANLHTFQNDDAIAPPLDLLPLTSEPEVRGRECPLLSHVEIPVYPGD